MRSSKQRVGRHAKLKTDESHIDDFELPDRLVADLIHGGIVLSSSALALFAEKVSHLSGELRPKFHNRKTIESCANFFESEHNDIYVGSKREGIVPGDIDRSKTLIIGEVDSDSPIALDYRTPVPSVIYCGGMENQTYWFELSPTYEALVDELGIDAAVVEVLSPVVQQINWGVTEVKDFGTFKDVKLFPGGARAWDWNETGTRHEPGVQVADVEELLEAGAKVVVLSRGMHERLQVSEQTIRDLVERGISVVVEETKTAVDTYNQLALKGDRAGALIHSTC